MFKVKQTNCIEGQPELEFKVVESLSGVSVCLFDPRDASACHARFSEADAAVVAGMLNAYIMDVDDDATSPGLN